MELVPWTYPRAQLAQPSDAPLRFTFCGKLLIITEDRAKDISRHQNTAFKLWDGAYLLAKYLETAVHHGWLRLDGRSCVELGAGCGMVGMVACLLGASVVLADLPDVVQHIQSNVATNEDAFRDASGSISVQSLRWGEELREKTAFDYILCSDVIYDTETFNDLLETLKRLSKSGTQILMSYKPRGLGEEDFFVKLRSTKLFEMRTIDASQYPAEYPYSPYSLFCITRSA